MFKTIFEILFCWIVNSNQGVNLNFGDTSSRLTNKIFNSNLQKYCFRMQISTIKNHIYFYLKFVWLSIYLFWMEKLKENIK